jgi:hypothetical protein
VIDPRDYAEAIARAIPARVRATAVPSETPDKVGPLYEVRIGDRVVVRLPKDEAVAFLDGMIAGLHTPVAGSLRADRRADRGVELGLRVYRFPKECLRVAFATLAGMALHPRT